MVHTRPELPVRALHLLRAEMRHRAPIRKTGQKISELQVALILFGYYLLYLKDYLFSSNLAWQYFFTFLRFSK